MNSTRASPRSRPMPSCPAAADLFPRTAHFSNPPHQVTHPRRVNPSTAQTTSIPASHGVSSAVSLQTGRGLGLASVRSAVGFGVGSDVGTRSSKSPVLNHRAGPWAQPLSSLSPTVSPTAPPSGRWLPDMDLNHDKQIQSLLCYRYTIGQSVQAQRLGIRG